MPLRPEACLKIELAFAGEPDAVVLVDPRRRSPGRELTWPVPGQPDTEQRNA